MITNAIEGKVPAVAINDAKLYVSGVSLSTQDTVKPLQQLKSGFKRKIDWGRYRLKFKI